MEEDAEGMLRPKPKEQPMPKLRRGMGDLSVWSFRGCRKQSGADGTDAEVWARERQRLSHEQASGLRPEACV